MPPAQEPCSGSITPHQLPPQFAPHRLQLPLAIPITPAATAAASLATLASTGSSTLHLHRQAHIARLLQADAAAQGPIRHPAARGRGGVAVGEW